MRARAVLGVLLVLLVQETVIPQVKIAGTYPDVVTGFVAVAGLLAGPERGAMVGFAAGLGEDLFLHEPFGMSALVYTILGFAVASLAAGSSVSATRLSTSFYAAGGSALAVTAYALVGALLGQSQMLGGELGRTVGIVAAVNFVVALPLAKVARWSFPSPATTPARS